MSSFRAPIALRTPISRVRSVTLTSMIFMMPMPAASSAIALTTNAPMRIVAATCANADTSVSLE